MYVFVSVDKYVGQWTRHERVSNFKLLKLFTSNWS